jgi:putative transposase
VSRRRQENEVLLTEIKEVHGSVWGSYGSPRMTAELHSRGYTCGHNRVARLMKKNGIIAKRTIRFRRLTKAGKKPAAENLLDRQFAVSSANSVWASDITYIPTAEGFLYLAVVIDLFSRRVVGWGMSSRLNPELVMRALSQALRRRGIPAGLMHHSDRDVLYSGTSYQRLLAEYGIQCSMSRKGNCYDNACVESFFGSLKNELVHYVKYESRDQAALDIFGWIEVFYNRVRKHSTLGYLSPVDYEQEKC